jgi:predicted 3-demethylubiquinone-9 3-methyltransferase (glyoxalase superfamily)
VPSSKAAEVCGREQEDALGGRGSTRGVHLLHDFHLTEDIDYYWDKRSNGAPQAQQCGWLKDKYGLSWQVVPRIMPELFKDHDSAKAQRAMDALLRMKKINIAELEQTATVELAGRS